ncbi:hypothetical protein GIB67_041060 [Kingdonia uniflora]|uniref:Uncharacterized protein n=1 Tax=Kingdonia uniflora TaxID=39325 RepID=A0A7J7LKC2_9MAGN|nr:hypothetical protein GIB67_041060 [Kingdonia uniflora]
MGLLPLLLLLLLLLLLTKAQSTTRAQQRSLDATLQDYAYKAFVRPRTGKEFKANVPYNLNGMKLSAMRLKSGSLFTRGVTKYNQFQIPVGVIEEPYVQRLVLVYQNLGDWSSVYYPLPEFSNVSSGNICSTVQQGHFSIVVEYQPVAPSPAPEMATQPPPQGKKKDKWKVWKIVGVVIGGFILLLLLGLLIIGGKRYKSKKKMKQMEKASDVGEALKMTSVGNARAPVAMVTRTQPVLENEYVP